MNFKGKIGVEIECISKDKNHDKLNDLCREYDWVLSCDGSIRRYKNNERAYEFKSKVYDVKDIATLFEVTDKFLKLVRVNTSCGLHIHLSFNNTLDYYKLYDWKFIDKFQAVLVKQFKSKVEKDRMSNSFCSFYHDKDGFDETTTEQLKSMFKTNSRYRAINFNSYNLYKTIEFRIFPATSKIKKFQKYVSMVVKNVDTYLINPLILPEYTTSLRRNTHANSNVPVVIKEIIHKGEISHV